MKRIIIAFACCCALCASCKKDKSLAGSIVFTDSSKVASLFGGVIDNRKSGEISFEKISDVETQLNCTIYNADKSFWMKIRVPRIPLSGEPERVSFDCVSPDAVVNYGGVEYSPVSLSIKGRVMSFSEDRFFIDINGTVADQEMILRIMPTFVIID